MQITGNRVRGAQADSGSAPCPRSHASRFRSAAVPFSGANVCKGSPAPLPQAMSSTSTWRHSKALCPVICWSAATAAPPEEGTVSLPAGYKRLLDCEMMPVIGNGGAINPLVPANAGPCVFAIYDDKLRLQYIGTVLDLRSALRACLGRRPEKAHYYRAMHLDKCEEPEVAAFAARDAWFEECGGAPKGNKMAMERTAWTQPVESGAISERGKRGAAEQTAKMLIAAIRDRGCTEDFVANPQLLDQGLVEFLAAEGMSEEDSEAARAAAEARAKECRSMVTYVDGVEKKCLVLYRMKHQTRGGYLFDVVLTADHMDTRHRVIVGKEYYEPHGLPPEAAVEAALAVLISLKVPRQTEGMIDSATFTSNYFCMGQIDQWFGEQFEIEFARITGSGLEDEEIRAQGHWRFNRIHDLTAMRLEAPDRMDDPFAPAREKFIYKPETMPEYESDPEDDLPAPKAGTAAGSQFGRVFKSPAPKRDKDLMDDSDEVMMII